MTFGFSASSKVPSKLQSKGQKLARVTDPIIPLWEGLVFFEGTYWQARFHDPNCQKTVYPGEKVEVIEREALTLLVMPIGLNPLPIMPQEIPSYRPPQNFQINQWVQRLGGFLSLY